MILQCEFVRDTLYIPRASRMTLRCARNLIWRWQRQLCFHVFKCWKSAIRLFSAGACTLLCGRVRGWETDVLLMPVCTTFGVHCMHVKTWMQMYPMQANGWLLTGPDDNGHWHDLPQMSAISPIEWPLYDPSEYSDITIPIQSPGAVKMGLLNDLPLPRSRVADSGLILCKAVRAVTCRPHQEYYAPYIDYINDTEEIYRNRRFSAAIWRETGFVVWKSLRLIHLASFSLWHLFGDVHKAMEGDHITKAVPELPNDVWGLILKKLSENGHGALRRVMPTSRMFRKLTLNLTSKEISIMAMPFVRLLYLFRGILSARLSSSWLCSTAIKNLY